MSVPFVQTPQALLFDTSVSAGAVRLYDIIRVCQWRGRALSADEVAELAGTNRRSLYRFLDELAAAGWATFDKRRGVTDLLERVTLHETRCAEFGTPSQADEARCAEYDTLGVPNSARRCDKIGTPSEILPAPRATKTAPVDPDRSSGVDHTTTPLPPTDATPPAASRAEQQRGGGGSATPQKPGTSSSPPEGARYLVSEDFGYYAVQTWGHLPVEVLRASVERHRAKGKQNGGIVNAWRIVPPDQEAKPKSTTPAAPPVRPAPLDDAPPEMSAEQRRALLAKMRLQVAS